MKKKILVTGGSGFIGSALVKRLVKDGYGVRVLDDASRGPLRRLDDVKNDVEIFSGDVRDPGTVMRACKGVDSIYHLAFVNGTEFFYSMPEKVLDVGVKGIVNVIDAALENHVPELVLASSSEVYQTPERVPTDESAAISIPDPLNPRYSYAGGKIISELMALNYGRKHFKRVLVFRPHNVYGPDMGTEHVIPQFIRRMADLSGGRFEIQGTGGETRAFVYIDDFVDGVMLLERSGEHMNIYHIGTENEISIAELAKKVGSYFKKKIELVPGKLSAGGTPRRCPDISKMKALGYSPKISLDEGIAKTAKWYSDNMKGA